jgi:hypothetical protein
MSQGAPPDFREPLSLEDRATLRLDLRAELNVLEEQIAELKTEYELYFTGINPLPPDKLHATVKRAIRTLISAPFKNAEMHFRLRTLKNRHQTFDTYFQRVLREREEGTYQRDLFKAALHEQNQKEAQRAQTSQGAAEQQFRDLFHSYRRALELHTGQKPNIDFDRFQKMLMTRAKDLKQKLGVKKLAFQIQVKDGKVTVRATPKETP